MINFRYHLISVVAIFLALGIGIVMGSTVIDRAIVDGLQNRIDVAEKNSIERKVENERLRDAVERQNAQDSALAPHSVRNYLDGQTVYVLAIGDVSDDLIVETRELLAVSGARLGSEVLFNSSFLLSNKTALAKEIQAEENMKDVFGETKDANTKIAISLAESINVRDGGTSGVAFSSEAVLNIFAKNNVFNERENAASGQPNQPISFLMLVNRKDLNNTNVKNFVVNFQTRFPSTIGFIGTDIEQPSRSKSIELVTDATDIFSIVDNVESPSGRAALVITHSGTIAGKKDIYGVSNRASSPAPILGS